MVEHALEISVGITLWYLTSFGTLLLNKHILNTMHVQPNTLAVVQMVSTAIYGALKTVNWSQLVTEAAQVLSGRSSGKSSLSHAAMGLDDAATRQKWERWRRSIGQMSFVGGMRFSTVVLGLVSLKHVAASFTETIKASAPFFTVIIAYLMLGEKTSPDVCLALVPVAGGLVLTSYTELSFNIVGFGAAVATNVIECVQNVFSKRLLATDYTASQLQFYTSITALVLQAPLVLFSADGPPLPVQVSAPGPSLMNATELDGYASDNSSVLLDGFVNEPSELVLTRGALAILWIDGVLYHMQSVVAYVVMSYLSPVTVSVVNTLKRALLIWISVLVFGNQVTSAAQLGTAICLGGVLWYNMARSGVSFKSLMRRLGIQASSDAKWERTS